MTLLPVLAPYVALLLALAALALALRTRARGVEHLRLLGEQTLAAVRAEAETTRAHLAASERALAAAIQAGTTTALGQAFSQITAATTGVSTTIDTLRRAAAEDQQRNAALLETRLTEIQKSVNEQLHAAVEKQMETSFARVIDQFAAVQKAMGDVQAVTAQIGDIKRLFGNVKTRGGWGEAQLRATLEDVLPPGSFEANRKLREGSDEMVDFAVAMPMRGQERTWLPVDAKFPMEDYERLLIAVEAGDSEGERTARRGIERQVRNEAKKIREKYIVPPATVEFAVMYLATDGLYAEVAHIPGLIDEIGREHRVLVLGPSLFPALLRTIQLGYVTLALEEKADEIRQILGATRAEMQKMDLVLERLEKNAGTMRNTIEAARTRTRAVNRKLRSIETTDPALADQLLDLPAEPEVDQEK